MFYFIGVLKEVFYIMEGFYIILIFFFGIDVRCNGVGIVGGSNSINR